MKHILVSENMVLSGAGPLRILVPVIPGTGTPSDERCP